MIARRSFIRGMGALLAAPAIVRASSLMPVRKLALLDDQIERLLRPPFGRTVRTYIDVSMIRNKNILLLASDYAGAPASRSMTIRIIE